MPPKKTTAPKKKTILYSPASLAGGLLPPMGSKYHELSYNEQSKMNTAARKAEQTRATKFRESSDHSDASLMKTIGAMLRQVQFDARITAAAKKDIVAYVRKVEAMGGAKGIIRGLPGVYGDLGKLAHKQHSKVVGNADSTGAVIEYIITELLAASLVKARADKRKTIKPEDVLMAIATDADLAQLFLCRC